MLVYDIVFSLTIVAICLIVFIRLVSDYRLVFTVSKLLKKEYKVTPKRPLVISLGIDMFLQNYDIISVECVNGQAYLEHPDIIVIKDVQPDLYTGKAYLYVTVRVYGRLDTYEITRRITLSFA
ncbi:MAG: hypothetical protein GXO26_03950 [Crenarchaeota archaeon]|nr:hypothetical protein [Thermoproteota archaeon]